MDGRSSLSLGTGDSAGPYAILGRLGAGGMGEVFLARDNRLERRVALKCLFDAPTDDEAHRRALTEARAAARIMHPNVAAVHDVFTQDGRTFIVMEYVEGESLADRMARGLLPIDVTIGLARQLSAAVAAAHAQGVVHRDLKPSNAQITPDGTLKVLDFGIARFAAAFTTHTADAQNPALSALPPTRRAGTPGYMAPEQALGLTVDERSDIYSLGAVLYEMVTGRRVEPLAGPDGTSRYARPRADAVNPQVPRALAEIIEKALAPEPGARFQKAAEVERALAALPPPRPAVTRQLLVLGVSAGIVVLAGIFGFYRWYTVAPAAPPAIRSIAVLPLVNDSGNPSQEYFVDGMTDGLINSLGRVSALRVTARSSSMLFKRTTKPIGQIARELGVDAIVEGSAVAMTMPDGSDRVRVAVSLIDPATQQQIWSDTVDRRMADVLTLQDEVARSLANKIERAVARQDPRSQSAAVAVDPEAFRAYLLGRERWNNRTVPSIREAIGYFQQAIAKDPKYAPAYAGLADSYVLLAGDFGAMPRDAGAQAAISSANRALELDPALAEAYASLGFAGFFLQWDWDAAERHLKRAIELNPSYATAHHWYGNLLSDLGREDEGLVQMRLALELDPLSPIISRDVAWPLFFSRRYDEAIQQLQKTLAGHPGFLPAERLLARAIAMRGDPSDAVRRFRDLRGRDDSPRSRCELAWAYALAGLRAEAARELESARTIPGGRVYPYDVALVLAALGRQQDALAALEEAYEQRDSTLVNLKHDPRFDAIRGDSRFVGLLRRMRFP